MATDLPVLEHMHGWSSQISPGTEKKLEEYETMLPKTTKKSVPNASYYLSHRQGGVSGMEPLGHCLVSLISLNCRLQV